MKNFEKSTLTDLVQRVLNSVWREVSSRLFLSEDNPPWEWSYITWHQHILISYKLFVAACFSLLVRTTLTFGWQLVTCDVFGFKLVFNNTTVSIHSQTIMFLTTHWDSWSSLSFLLNPEPPLQHNGPMRIEDW